MRIIINCAPCYQASCGLIFFNQNKDLRRVLNSVSLIARALNVYNMSMTSDSKKVLFFIKSPSHNLKAIELFLSKRNFIVHTESDIKEALTQIIEIQPDFIFLGWDHSNPIATSLPKVIEQACPSVVVPYIMSNTKEAARKLNICPINPKLYPPVSGPAIERLILKSEKQSSDDLMKLTQVKAKMSTKEDLNNIKSLLVANLESFAQQAEDEDPEYSKEQQEESAQNEKKARQSSIEVRNSILRNAAQSSLNADKIDALKKSFEDKIKQPLTNLIKTMDESYGAVSVIDDPELKIGSVQSHDTQKISPDGVIVQKGTSLLDHGQVLHGEEQNSSMGSGSFTENQNHLKAYCMAIYSQNWCGYLVICTAVQLDFSSIDMVFTDWIKQHFENFVELDECDFFEFRELEPDFLKAMIQKADYHESVEVDHHNLDISFFPIESEKMNIDFNDDKSLIKVLTEDIPANTDLAFSLLLHLPENKKYLLYTQANKALNYEQKKRLIANKVFQLYTPLEFEKEYKKFMAEKNVREIYNALSKKFSAV